MELLGWIMLGLGCWIAVGVIVGVAVSRLFENRERCAPQAEPSRQSPFVLTPARDLGGGSRSGPSGHPAVDGRTHAGAVVESHAELFRAAEPGGARDGPH